MPWIFHAANFYKYLDINATAFCLSPNVCVYVCVQLTEIEGMKKNTKLSETNYMEQKQKIPIRQEVNDSWWSAGPWRENHNRNSVDWPCAFLCLSVTSLPMTQGSDNVLE